MLFLLTSAGCPAPTPGAETSQDVDARRQARPGPRAAGEACGCGGDVPRAPCVDDAAPRPRASRNAGHGSGCRRVCRGPGEVRRGGGDLGPGARGAETGILAPAPRNASFVCTHVPYTHTYTRTHARTHARARARTHTHTHTHRASTYLPVLTCTGHNTGIYIRHSGSTTQTLCGASRCSSSACHAKAGTRRLTVSGSIAQTMHRSPTMMFSTTHWITQTMTSTTTRLTS